MYKHNKNNQMISKAPRTISKCFKNCRKISHRENNHWISSNNLRIGDFVCKTQIYSKFHAIGGKFVHFSWRSLIRIIDRWYT